FEDPELRVGEIRLAEGPEEVRVLVDDLRPEDGRLVDQPLAGPLAWGGEERLPPGAVLRLEIVVEVERGEGLLPPVVTAQDRVVGAGRQPEGEVNGEVRVDTLSLHGLDDVVRVGDLPRL